MKERGREGQRRKRNSIKEKKKATNRSRHREVALIISGGEELFVANGLDRVEVGSLGGGDIAEADTDNGTNCERDENTPHRNNNGEPDEETQTSPEEAD